jgi:hypothetical protein
MRPFWQTGFGKLVVGSCGAQIGLLLSLGGLVVVVLFCAVCMVTNVVSLGLTRGLLETSSSATVPASATSSPAEVESLLEQVNALLTEVEALQLEEPLPVPPPPLVAGGKPVIMAGQNPVSLYSSPDIEAEPVALLPTGASVEIVGRNNSSTWWLVALSDGRFAWAFNALVTALNVNDTIPVVTTPSELAQPASFSLVADITPLPPVEPLPPTATPVPTLPPGTPTPAAEASRQYIEDTPAYQRVRASLLVPPVSASFSPDGSQFAMTERIRLYTIGLAGAYTEIWLEDTDREGPVGNVVWSPDGKHIAFVLGFKQHRYCQPCRAVGLLTLAEKSITYLTPPDPKLDTDMPRWTQDGRLLINVYLGEPASGVAYVYNIYGEYQKADGIYTLSASHEGQKWFPWRPGRVWQAGVSERADSYNSD